MFRKLICASLQIMIQNDIKRLFSIFLDGNEELKNYLPTKNI
jgi:hypothetical protein